MEALAFAGVAALWSAVAVARAGDAGAAGGRDPDSGVDRAHLAVLAKHRAVFGSAVRGEFSLDWSYTHLNHGSYGTAPRRVVAAAAAEMAIIEAYPDDFFRRRALPRYVAVCEAVGRWLGAPPGSVVLVDNATAAVNTVLRALAPALRPGDVLLLNDHTYAACRNAVLDVAAKAGAEVVTARLPLPVGSPEGLTEPLLAAARAVVADPGKRLAFVLLDHITSPTALVLPVGAMTRALKALSPGTVVMVDGAHVPGQLPLRLGGSAGAGGDDPFDVGGPGGVDYYCGNLHKWAFALKGCAFLYTAPPRQEATQGPSVSHFWRRPYQERFFMQGTGDFSRYMSVPAALAYATGRDYAALDAGTGEPTPVPTPLGSTGAVREYNAAVVRAGAALCAAAWGTGTLLPAGADPSLCAPFMVPVRLPLDVRAFLTGVADPAALDHGAAADAADADDGLNERASVAIWRRSRVQAQVVWWRCSSAPGGRGALYVRLSGQVYNTLDDYRALADAVTALAADIAKAGGASAVHRPWLAPL
jgi:isopenicillin-N epimerase